MRETVKSRRFRGRAWLVAALLVLAPQGARAVSLGSPEPPASAPVELDPWLPTGAELPVRLPAPTGEQGCSFRAPVCVRRAERVSAGTAGRALEALETAYARLVWAMRLPAPSGLVVLELTAAGETELTVAHGAIAASRFDRARARCVLSGAQRSLIERDAALCVGEAIAWRLDASASPFVKRAYAEHLWLASGRPTALDVEAIDDFQARPDLAVLARERTARAEGAALLFEHLDAALSNADAGVLATSLLAAASGKTPPASWQWNDEPDVFDVLRHTAGKDPRAIAELVGDFAVARAFVGNRNDGTHVPTLDFTGAFGRVHFDWVIPFSSLPRRVLAARPLEDTGSIYVWVGLDRVPKGVSLALQAKWEPPVSFRWSMVRVGKDGRELGRVHAAYQERATEVEQRLVNLEGAAGIIVIGTNMGGIDLKHPFDPDVEPFEPHACTVYLAAI